MLATYLFSIMYNTGAGMTQSPPHQIWQHPLMPELAIDGDFCRPSMSACYDHLPIIIVWDAAGIPVRFKVNITCLKCR